MNDSTTYARASSIAGEVGRPSTTWLKDFALPNEITDLDLQRLDEAADELIVDFRYHRYGRCRCEYCDHHDKWDRLRVAADRIVRVSNPLVDVDPINRAFRVLARVQDWADALDPVKHAWDTGYEHSVYIMAQRDLFKVGFTTRDPDQRRGEIERSSGVPTTLVTYWDGDRSTEAHIHKLLAEHRTCGEWFSVNEATKRWLREVDAWDLHPPFEDLVPTPKPQVDYGYDPDSEEFAA